jgi:hypothetical protein
MRVLAGWKSIIKGVARESKRERGQCDCVGVALFTGVFGLIWAWCIVLAFDLSKMR